MFASPFCRAHETNSPHTETAVSALATGESGVAASDVQAVAAAASAAPHSTSTKRGKRILVMATKLRAGTSYCRLPAVNSGSSTPDSRCVDPRQPLGTLRADYPPRG